MIPRVDDGNRKKNLMDNNDTDKDKYGKMMIMMLIMMVMIPISGDKYYQ